MKNRKSVSEEAVAEQVVAWLIEGGWDVYQEVKHRGSRADICATRSGLWWVIEVKTSFSLRVMAQAWEWVKLGCANLVSVATPTTMFKSDPDTAFKRRILSDYGIGWLRSVKDREGVYEDIWPRFRRKIVFPIRVYEEQRWYAPAGNSNGRAYTPWAATRDDVIRIVQKTPGISMKELMSSIEHHYASSATARTCIARDIQYGIYKGIKAEKVKGKLCLFPQVVDFKVTKEAEA